MPVPVEDLRALSDACVRLVEEQHGRRLAGNLDSLEVLDDVCRELLANGPLVPDRLQLWTDLIGAYTGEVLIAAYDGGWVEHEDGIGVLALGVTAFPFNTAHRVLEGEGFKSLASVGRALPATAGRGGPSAGDGE